MRKGDNGEEKKWGKKNGEKKKKIMMKIVATNGVASRPPNADRLQCRPLVPIIVILLNSKQNTIGIVLSKSATSFWTIQ